MNLLFGNIALYVGSSQGLVTIPELNQIDESFSFKDEVVYNSTHPGYQICLQHKTVITNDINVGHSTM